MPNRVVPVEAVLGARRVQVHVARRAARRVLLRLQPRELHAEAVADLLAGQRHVQALERQHRLRLLLRLHALRVTIRATRHVV